MDRAHSGGGHNEDDVASPVTTQSRRSRQRSKKKNEDKDYETDQGEDGQVPGVGPQEHDRANVFNTMEKQIGNNTQTTQLLPEKLSSANGRLPADFIDGNIAEIEQADR